VVGDVAPNSIAARAGLHSEDLITRLQGREVSTLEGVLTGLIENVADGTVKLQVRGEMGRGEPREVVLQTGPGRRDLTEPESMMTGLGFDFWRPSLPAVIGSIVPGGAAEQAGLKMGDRIVSVDAQPVTSFNSLVDLVKPRMNREVVFSVERGTEMMNVLVKIGEHTRDGHQEGMLGVGAQGTPSIPDEMRSLQKFGPGIALIRGAQQTWETSTLTLKLVWKMIVGEVSTKNLTGAVGMVEYSGVIARQGVLPFLGFLAAISISLGIFNLLPIPMLDGGQILYQLVELLKGSPVSERIQLISQQIGVAMLLMLLSLTLYNDIARHLS
jgi:regulator of sigma E protease